jgi:hypothetical protein
VGLAIEQRDVSLVDCMEAVDGTKDVIITLTGAHARHQRRLRVPGGPKFGRFSWQSSHT